MLSATTKKRKSKPQSTGEGENLPFLSTLKRQEDMKKIMYCAFALAIGVSAGYSVGKDSYRSIKDYQSACMLGDICKFAIENGNTEFEELYEDYLSNVDCDPRAIVTREEVESYTWIYNNK